MTGSSPSPQWRSLPASSLVDVLAEDEDIDDVVALTGAQIPTWLQRLSIPIDWQLVGLPEVRDQPIMRMAVSGPLGNGEFQAADTIAVFSYTGWPVFYDVLRNADRTLRGLKSTGVAVRVLPVPPTQWTAAVRASGIALIGDRSVWVQQSNYVAGSEQPHAGRLVMHSLFVDTACRTRLAEDIAQLSDAVYEGFIAARDNEHRAG